MSTILKALKKLEERKAAEGQRKGDIAWDILREEQRGRTLEMRPLYVVLLLSGVLVLLALAWYFIPLREEISGASLAGDESTRHEQHTKQTDLPPAEHSAERSLKATPVNFKSSVGEAVSAPAPAPVPAGLQLTVSGIAYQDNAEARLAIVNDLPVMVGTMIDGVVIEKIETDRVVFSQHGDRFSIYFPARHD